MTNRFSRFQNIERTREDKAGDEGRVALHDGRRFESVEGPRQAVPEAEVPEAHLERFRLHGQTPVVLDTVPESQRFPRCIRCQTSNGRFNQTCTTCGADLQSPEQRAEDEARWLAEAEGAARMKAAMVVPSAVELEQAVEADAAGEEEVDLRVFEPSLGQGLLRRIAQPVARWAVLAGVLGVPWLLTRAPAEPVRIFGVMVGVMVCTSFVPSSFWTGARRR
ncbi:hypothetical protein [Melittangium boletus]|uniref:hypothetical protein n=1 Tax=Melittangium boletus TaxID=83453 RepID=UPI003DA3AE30